VDNGDLSASISHEISVDEGPAVIVTYSNSITAGLPTYFNANQTFDPDGYIQSWNWTFGDGSIGSGEIVSHTYTNPGTYSVTMTVVDSSHWIGVISFTINVAPFNLDQPPIAVFTLSPANATVGQTVFFNGAGSYDPDGYVQSWSWSFGDGYTGSGPQPIHSYNNPGYYVVTLTVTDNGGLSATTSMTVSVRTDLPPVASFKSSPSNPKVGQQVFFDGSASYDPDGFIQSYFWSFGDGTSQSFSSSASHVYTSPSNYTVTLTVTDNNGLTNSTSLVVSVHPRPTHDVAITSVNAYPSLVVSSQTVSVNVGLQNNGSSNETVSVTAYYGTKVIGTVNGVFLPVSTCFYCNFGVQLLWDTTEVPAGNYTISATMFLSLDENKSDNSLTDGAVTVLPPPALTITPTTGPQGTQVQLQASGFPVPPYAPSSTVLVTFDDQLIGFATSPNGQFTSPFNIPLSQTGTHNVKALDSSGAKSTAIFIVTATPTESKVDVKVTAGSIYFPGDTAVIFVQTSINGQPISVTNIQMTVTLPSGPDVTLSPVMVASGEWKASFPVPSRNSIGTYSITVRAQRSGSLDGTALSGFEVKPTWIQGHSSAVMVALAVLGVVSVGVVSWRTGYLKPPRKSPVDSASE